MNETLTILQQNLGQALWETFEMVFISGLIGVIFGTIIGLALYYFANPLFSPRPVVNTVVGFIINAIRSFPFLILMVVLIPFAKWVAGDPYTPMGGAVSLTVAAVPFFARLAEGAFAEIDQGVIEAARSTGASFWLIFQEVLFPEALPALIRGIVLTIISLIGYSAMVGTIGAGGIGNLAIQFGYNRYETGVLISVIIILVIIVQVIQWIGDRLAAHFTRA
ncbi:ABC transporter permease subunit [Secundilactobacillus kimchicus]|uniref:methionine ABC transporter permease n=1 Tax=Secundilactobacillus kimchicus TaxID=528209 RepID=UPI001C00CD78|nr:methionine ABC transporter permease [Secundilactobacillus kimchicus]MBT9671164.1 ABC transporter permease subunit [Secundilactobacillus kimchicus]